MEEWQPIETAPNNDNEVLIYASNSIFVAFKIDEIWYTETGCPDPTHWMPLPKPPSA